MSNFRQICEDYFDGNSPITNATFKTFPEPEQISDSLLFLSGFANVSVIETSTGLVMIDSGLEVEAESNFAKIRSFSDKPLLTAIFTHGHVDHVCGLGPFLINQTEPVDIVGHKNLPFRFDRYIKTAGYNSSINKRQFGVTQLAWPTSYAYPTTTYEDELELNLDGFQFLVKHFKGETDDHSVIYESKRGWLFTGDLFIWATPNAGNPQKVERYPDKWAEALRYMASLKNLNILIPGHGLPIFGSDRIRRALIDTADLLEEIVEQTLSSMNAGYSLEQTLRSVNITAYFLKKPYLQATYDEPEFIVRNIWRRFGGWFDGHPSSLHPSDKSLLSKEISSFVSPIELANRAFELVKISDDVKVDNGNTVSLVESSKVSENLRVAIDLAWMAYLADPDNKQVKEIVAEIFKAASDKSSSLMSRSIYAYFFRILSQ